MTSRLVSVLAPTSFAICIQVGHTSWMVRKMLVASGLIAMVAAAAIFGILAYQRPSGPSYQRWDGMVTVKQPFCVGRYAATGECFNANPILVAKLQVGDCVQVTYNPKDEGVKRQSLHSVTKISSSDDPRDCPGSSRQ